MTTADKIRSRLLECANILTFDYKGTHFGVEPFSRERYEIYYPDSTVTLKSVDEVMSEPLFFDKSLLEIAEEIEIDEF